MAFQRYGQHDQSYICDDIADLANLPKANMGSTCYVIATAEKYMINSKGQWILQVASTQGNNGGGNGDIDLSKYATIKYSDAKDEEMLQNTDEHIAQILDKGNTNLVDALTKQTASIVDEALADVDGAAAWGTLD